MIKKEKDRMRGRKEDDERKKRGMRNMKCVGEERERKPLEKEKAIK
jgi:hypothetical protein